jgi:putative transposase
MYRILHANIEVRDRRNPARHPAHVKPELVADAPNQVWSWDITKLAGPQKWTWFHLYVIIDVFSRFIVGWHVATRETAALAQVMINTAIDNEHVPAGVHHGRANDIRDRRQQALDNAYHHHPERFVRQSPQAPTLATQAWINQPTN